MEQREREINLVDVLWKIAFAWRALLVVGIAFALLVPAAMYAKDLKAYKASSLKQATLENAKDNTLSKEESRKSLVKSLSDDEINAVETAVMYEKELGAATDYCENSPVMAIDPYHSDEIVLEYYIRSGYELDETGTNKESYTPALVAAYLNLINNGSAANSISEASNGSLSSSDILELISAAASTSMNNVTITVTGADEKTRNAIASGIQSEIESHTKGFTDTIGTHEIILLSEYKVNRVNQDILKKQSTAKSAVVTAKDNLAKTRKGMSEAQLDLLMLASGDVESAAVNAAQVTNEEEKNTNVAVAKPSFRVKYAVIGLIVGIFIVIVIIFLREVLSGKMRYEYELKELFGVDVLGVLRKDKTYRGIDKLLYNLRYRNKRQLTEEEARSHLVKNISLICKEKNVQSLFVTGSCLTELAESSRTAIINELSSSEVTVSFGDNVIYDKESLEAANEIKNLLIVEKIGVSAIEEITKEIETVKEHGVDIIGGVVLA